MCIATCEFQKTGSAGNGSFVNLMLFQAGLANNGGPTQTIALLPGSPAIDAIPLADCTDQALPPNPITTDQRGFPRPDGTESLCDIGAYEFQDVGSPFVPFASFRGHLTIDPKAGVFYLSGGFKLAPAAVSIQRRSRWHSAWAGMQSACRLAPLSGPSHPLVGRAFNHS